MLPFYVALALAAIYFVLGLKKPGLALITMPIACGAFVYLTSTPAEPGTTFQVLLAIPIIVLTTLSSVLLAKHDPISRQWPRRWAGRLLLGFALLLFVITGIFAMVNLPSLGCPFLWIFVAIVGLGGAVINYGLTSRHAVAAYVISTIGSSMRQNLPLPMALESAAGGRTDRRARILQGISRWLIRGCSVGEAIRRGSAKSVR